MGCCGYYPGTNLQTDTPSGLFSHPITCETSTTSPAEISHVRARPFNPSKLKQIKQAYAEIEKDEPRQQFTGKSGHKQHAVKDFSTFSKKLDGQVLELSALVTTSASVKPTDEKTTENVQKGESAFIFYKCRFCGLTYNYLTTLRAHERVHNIDEPYKCNRCAESFHYMCELEYHAKQHSDLKGYKCECGRTFHTYTDLLYHKHPGDEEKESFIATAPTAAKHTLPIPENDSPIPEFTEKKFEPRHPLKVYSDMRLNPYICQYCSKSYPNSRTNTCDDVVTTSSQLMHATTS